jgi:hypothetical protein
MSSRKLRVTDVKVETVGPIVVGGQRTGVDVTQVIITFSRKLTALEVSGVKAVMEGELK